MKNLKRSLLISFLTGFLAVWPGVSIHARVTGTAPASTSPDTWCMGRSGAEVCIDRDGNFIPTTDNDTTLGTSSLRWATIYALDQTIGDDLTVTDDLAVNGDATLGDAAGDNVTVNATTFTFSTSWLYFSTATTPGTNVMTLDGTNFRVGVNDATPDAALDVGGSFTFDGSGTFGDAAADTLTINASTVVVPTVILAFATSTVPGRNIITLDGAAYRLGVNITTPTATLDVAGSAVLGATVTQTIDLNGLLRIAVHGTPDASVTPTAANQLIWNTGQTPAELCQSTGTGAGAWIVFSTRSASCSN